MLRAVVRSGLRLGALRSPLPPPRPLISPFTFALRSLSSGLELPPSDIATDLATDLSSHLTTDLPSLLEIAPTVTKLAEPTLKSLGLACNTPPGLLQSCLEFFHVSCDLPWWGAIVVGTVCVRIIIFPLVIIAQRNAAKMHNNMPQMMQIQMRMTQARIANNRMEATKAAEELAMFMREKGANPFKNLVAPLAQAPFFISFFMGLRGMAECPVESMKHGGLFWFENLTVPDPIYLLPFVTSATMYFVIVLGADSGKLPEQMKNFKYVLRAMPVVMFPIICQFPAAMLCYWCTTNFISLIQVSILKIPQVRDYFNIPKLINHPPGSMPSIPKMTATDSWANIKISKAMEDRNELDRLLKENAEMKEAKNRRTKKPDQTE